MGRLTISDIESIKNTLEKLRTETMDTHGRISLIDDENIYEAINAVEKLAHYEDLEEQGKLVEQKQGYWIKSRKYYDDGYTVIGACSICGLEFQAKLLRKICYCPHCGAKMDEVE